jgi:hypothetical protein
MKILSKALTTVAGVAAVSAAMITDVQAVPAFARQTGMACVSCHSGNYPALNAFGRAFLSSGYTMRGAAPLVEGEDLSIPADLKMALVTKIRYELSDTVKGGRGEIQWPDEAGLLVGGRAAENIGFMAELGLMEPSGFGSFLSYKTHFNVTPNVSIVMFGTDGLGAGYGMELMNTGLKRSQRPIENRKGMSAFQRLGTGAGEAEGLAFTYHDNDLMVSYSQWAPHYGNVNANILGGLASNLRATYFMNVSGWDMGVGASYMSGTIKEGGTDPANEIVVAGQGIDFQAIGDIGTIPSEFYVSYGVTPKAKDADLAVGDPGYVDHTITNAFNGDTANDHTALGLLGKFYVAPKTSVYLAYGSTDDGTSATLNETTIGAQYMLAQNIKLELFNVSYSKDTGSDDYTMVELFSGF